MNEDILWSLIQASHAAACNLLFILAKRLRHTDSIIIEGVQLEQDFQHYGSVDALTGLHNRYWFDSMFKRQFARSVANGKPFSLLMVDVDYFKRLNDTYGHLLGDRALYEVSHVITGNVRPAELIARYGGDEFIILLPDRDIRIARRVAQRLQRAVADAPPISYGDENIFHPTLSIGISEMKKDQTPEMLIQAADEALYRAKNNGRNCIAE
jgi:diguanylate cyclase (GGDEF)-like protein